MVHACTYDARLVAVEAARHNPTNAVGGPSVNFVGGMFVWWRCGLTIEQRSMPPPIRTTRWPKHGKWPMLKEVFEDLEWPGGDVDVVMCQEQQRLAFSASGSSGDLTVRLPLFVRATHARLFLRATCVLQVWPQYRHKLLDNKSISAQIAYTLWHCSSTGSAHPLACSTTGRAHPLTLPQHRQSTPSDIAAAQAQRIAGQKSLGAAAHSFCQESGTQADLQERCQQSPQTDQSGCELIG
eukprot:1159031-Pelagomonas_calceolata.AAC.7